MLVSTGAFAADPALKVADMTILSKNGEFTGVVEAKVLQTYNTIVLEYSDLVSTIPYTFTLPILSVSAVGCGSFEIVAGIGEADGNRIHLSLIDHSRRVCEDARPYVWEAEVRKGYGWCGTMDSVMRLGGNPVEYHDQL